MKILWIYPELPYPLTSGYLRGFHLLRLIGHRHAVTFLCLTKHKRVPPETVLALKQYAERIAIFRTCSAPKPKWFTMFALIPILGWRLQEFLDTRWAVQQMKKYVRNLLQQERFDVVLFHGREALPVLDGVEVPIVVDCGDTNCTRILQEMRQSRFLLRPRLLFRYAWARRLEGRLARITPHRCFISVRDRENLLGTSDRSEIVPQGVDYDYWKRSLPPSRRNCIVFSGVMSYHPNAEAALFLLDSILPLVRKVCPQLEILIVGRDPSSELIKVAKRYSDVTVTGAVDDVRPYLERADVFVAALRFASGVQNKVLEALAMEVPVVTTPVVAAGLRVDGIEPQLVIGRNAEEIAACIVRLLGNSEERARLSTEGRRFVEAHCSWSSSAEKLEKLCLAAAENHRLQQGTGLCRLFEVEAPKTENAGPVSISPDSLRLDRASTVSIWENS
jgi:glycosyltransferase involved in cell wall biosynthesis